MLRSVSDILVSGIWFLVSGMRYLSVALSLKSPSPGITRHLRPVEPGLSSCAAFRHCTRDHLAYSNYVFAFCKEYALQNVRLTYSTLLYQLCQLNLKGSFSILLAKISTFGNLFFSSPTMRGTIILSVAKCPASIAQSPMSLIS
ncbi:hypothetical protein DFR58_11643 [Anaerobacterium chartisolvens]|uniref:Uncharacterized protein n=1 Tax=Anaerobacterium chartisolvens TaxID=1297424 RepID=A0A369AXC7_9FIRM|nr:hypothetical protein DFR58_11643 [Anaerobacterium chartisolvens]